PIRERLDLTRYRKEVIQDRRRVVNRLHKTLEDAGIKLASVASDVRGIAGRAMLEALVQGTTDPAMLAELARGRLRGKLPALRQSARRTLSGAPRVPDRAAVSAPRLSGRSHWDSERTGGDGDRPVCRRADAVGQHSRDQSAHRGGHHRGDWRGYERVSQCGSPRELGRPLSG